VFYITMHCGWNMILCTIDYIPNACKIYKFWSFYFYANNYIINKLFINKKNILLLGLCLWYFGFQDVKIVSCTKLLVIIGQVPTSAIQNFNVK